MAGVMDRSPPDVERDVLITKELAIKEKEEKQSTLVAAKDRGQFTATTAMLVVDIALLKEVIDLGPQGHSYYSASLALLWLSLTLQFIAGLIALVITNITNYYEKYNDDLFHDLCVNMCHCKCVRTAEQKVSPLAFCGCRCTTRVYEDYEYDIMERYDKSNQQLIVSRMTLVEAEGEIAFLTKELKVSRARKLELETKKGSTQEETDLNAISTDLEQVTLCIAEKEGKMKECNEKKHESTIQCEKSNVLYGYVDAIRKNQLLKKVSFWQHVINYLLYIILLTNAFITGLGIASPSRYQQLPDQGPLTNATVI